MIRFIFIGLLLYIGYRILISLTPANKTSVKTATRQDSGEETFRDPVCGVYVSEENAVIGKHDGERHFFCSMDCLEKYREQLDHTTSTS